MDPQLEPNLSPQPPLVMNHDPSIPFPAQWLHAYYDFPQLSSTHILQVDSEFQVCQQLLSPNPFPGPPQKGTLKRVKRTLIRYKHLLNLLQKYTQTLQTLPDHSTPHPSLTLNPHPTSPGQLLQAAASNQSHLLSQQGILMDLAASRFPDEIFQRLVHDLNISSAFPPLANGSAQSY